MKPYPRKCPNCRKIAVDLAVVDYQTRIEHDGRAYTLVLPSLNVRLCAACGERYLDLDGHDKVSHALRNAAGLLPPEEIRAKRLSLNLTQKALAEQLDIAEATLSRWETGAQIQQRAFDTLLRAYFDVPELRRYLARPLASPARAKEPIAASLPEPSMS